jgi:hypothetical protein
MTRSELAAETCSIMRLLREHAFLRYLPSGSQEYNEKLKAADGEFCRLVHQATGLVAPNPYPRSGLDTLDSADADSVVRIVRRIASRLASAAKKSSGAEAATLVRAAVVWNRVADAIASLPR